MTTEDHHWTAGTWLPVLVELREFAGTEFDPHFVAFTGSKR